MRGWRTRVGGRPAPNYEVTNLGWAARPRPAAGRAGGARHEPVAVGVGEAVVRPGPPGRFQPAQVELPLGEDHRLRAAVLLPVAVDGRGREAVVGADGLLLVDLRPEDIGVPELD